MTADPRDVLLSLCASLTLADHMGDAGNYVDTALKQIGVEFEWNDWDELAAELHKMGVKTLYGTSLGDDDE